MLSCSKKHSYFAPIACLPVFACQLWSKYTQTSMKRLRATYNNAYRITHYIPRNVSVRPHQVSHYCQDLWYPADKQFVSISYTMQIFIQLFIRSLQMSMLFTNLHFSSIIQRSCMMEAKCSSSWWIVSVFASPQYYFCVVKKCVGCVYTRSIQKEMLLKCFAPLNVGHVQTSIL